MFRMSTSSFLSSRVCVVTGSNKGIGLSIVKGIAKTEVGTVILCSRDIQRGEEAVKALHNEGLKKVVFEQLDVADMKSIEDFCKRTLEKYGKVDILVNNAGIGKDFAVPLLQANFDIIKETMQVNTYGPTRLCQLLIPKMVEQNFGRIVNVSSGTAQLSDMNGKHVAYRFSKVAINALTRIINDEYKDKNILANSMCPGFVKTDMTGGEKSPAKLTPEEGADTAVWLATLPDDGPRGGFFRRKAVIPW